MPYTLCRATSLFLTILLVRFLSVDAFWWLFFYVLFAHYFLAFFYSKNKIISGLKTTQGSLILGSTFGLGLILHTLQLPPLPLYFVLHSAFSDTYLIRSSRLQLITRLFFNISIYLALLKPLSTFFWEHQKLSCYFALGFYLVFVLSHFIANKDLSRKETWDQLAFESLPLFLLFYFKDSSIEFNQLIFYHLMMWTIVPHLTSGVSLLKLTLEHALACFVFAFLFFPFNSQQINALSYFWGYIHVTSSFILSSLNPSFLQFNFRKPLYSS